MTPLLDGTFLRWGEGTNFNREVEIRQPHATRLPQLRSGPPKAVKARSGRGAPAVRIVAAGAPSSEAILLLFWLRSPIPLWPAFT